MPIYRREKLYLYGFELNFSRQELVSEWLIDMTKPAEKIIFERDLKKKIINSDIKAKKWIFWNIFKRNEG